MSKANADKYFSLAIRAANGWECARCGKYFEPPTRQLQCSHLFSRKHNISRWWAGTDTIGTNAFAHCASCHAWLESRPPEMAAFAQQEMGIAKYEALRAYHHKVANFRKSDFAAIARHYKDQYATMSDSTSTYELTNYPFEVDDE